MEPRARPAEPSDVAGICDALRANAGDTSLAQQPRARVERHVTEFLVVCGSADEVLGCAQVHAHRPGYLEIMAVSIRPEAQGQGIGGALVRGAVEVALSSSPRVLWLSTEKPGYFQRFGFEPFSKFRLPISVLLTKLGVVFEQPVGRWLPWIFGRQVFMRHASVPLPEAGMK